MRVRRWHQTVACMQILLLLTFTAGCVGTAANTKAALEKVPTAFMDATKTERGLLEVRPWILTLRTAYVTAYQAKAMTKSEVALAIQADESLKSAWDTMVATLKQKQDPAIAQIAVYNALMEFQKLAIKYVAADVLTVQPVWARE